MADSLQATVWILGILLLALAPLWEAYKFVRRYQQLSAHLVAARAETSELQRRFDQTLAALDAMQQEQLAKRLLGCRPLASPPGFANVLADIDERSTDPYVLPLGWVTVDGQVDLVLASLHGESEMHCGHLLVTGETGAGKDGQLFVLTAALCRRARPDQLQIYWIDGKGPDGALWRGKRHNWREPVTREEDIPAALEALNAERQRRMQVIEACGVTKWEELPEAVRLQLPLLWIVVSELKLLKAAFGKDFEAALERELVSARAAGIRYCLSTQTATNMQTEWRSQIGLFVAGAQSSRDADKPNIGLGTDEIRERGGIPPSELPDRGYFTVRLKRQVLSVRASYISLDERKTLLAGLPAAEKVSELETVFKASERPETSFSVEMPLPVERPEPALFITPEIENRVAALRSAGKGKIAIVCEVWQVSPGGTERYKQACQAYEAILSRTTADTSRPQPTAQAV